MTGAGEGRGRSRPRGRAAHGPYGKTLSCLDMTIEPLTQDSCSFNDDFGVYADYRDVVLDNAVGERTG